MVFFKKKEQKQQETNKETTKQEPTFEEFQKWKNEQENKKVPEPPKHDKIEEVVILKEDEEIEEGLNQKEIPIKKQENEEPQDSEDIDESEFRKKLGELIYEYSDKMQTPLIYYNLCYLAKLVMESIENPQENIENETEQ